LAYPETAGLLAQQDAPDSSRSPRARRTGSPARRSTKQCPKPDSRRHRSKRRGREPQTHATILCSTAVARRTA
jgi:hypothetical protein